MNYDVIIVGGGLGGLIAAIQLAKNHCQVLLIEKYNYPFYKWNDWIKETVEKL
jgi:flavin-dependent dehydrogenase